jgi:ribose/xylose/arabinose/galactoside ABC-type transport system permease subunit
MASARKRKSILPVDRFEATLLILAVALPIFFSVVSPRFLVPFNVSTIMLTFALYYLAAMGESFVIMSGMLDLSVAGTLSLSGVVSASIICSCTTIVPAVQNAVPATTILFAIGASLLVGLGIGALNAVLVLKTRIPSFLATLGTLNVAIGIGFIISPSGLGLPLSHQLDFLLAPLVPGVPTFFLWAIVGALILWYVARSTKFGWKVYAIGSSDRSAALSGVNLNRTRTYVFLLSGVLAAVAGILYNAYVEAASPGEGQSLLFIALMIVILGGTSMNGGSGGPHRTILGAFILEIVLNGMALLGLTAWGIDILEGAIIIVVMFALSRGVKTLVA